MSEALFESHAGRLRVRPDKAGKSRITNGSAFLSGIDGRSAWIRRAKDLISEHLQDLGGFANASAAERSIVRRCAVLSVELENLEARFATAGSASADDLDLYQRTANSLRRLLEAVGLQRRPKTVVPSVSAYLEHLDKIAPKPSLEIPGEPADAVSASGWKDLTVPLRKALSDPQLLGGVLAGDSWKSWRILLIAAMGEALTDDERVVFKQLTGRDREPLARVEELAAVVGRRGGKSRAMSVLAVYIAALCKHALVRGETGVLLCIAPDQRQAGIVLGYAEAAFEQSPILRQLIANRTSDALVLTNGVSIEVRASSFRRLRGPTYVAVICDEADGGRVIVGLDLHQQTQAEKKYAVPFR